MKLKKTFCNSFYEYVKMALKMDFGNAKKDEHEI